MYVLIVPAIGLFADDGGITDVQIAGGTAVVESACEPLPEGLSGSDDSWHVHDVKQVAGTLTTGRPLLRFLVDRRMRRQTSDRQDDSTLLAMVHAWVCTTIPPDCSRSTIFRCHPCAQDCRSL